MWCYAMLCGVVLCGVELCCGGIDPSYVILVHMRVCACRWGRIVIMRSTVVHEDDITIKHQVIRWLC